MAPSLAIEPGEFYEVAYPFVREMYGEFDSEGPVDVQTWRPGTRFEDDGMGGVGCVADGMGRMELMPVSLHKPGEFPMRVFYLREWVDPDGKRFGKTRKLRMTTLNNFKVLLRGYRHDFEIAKVEAHS